MNGRGRVSCTSHRRGSLWAVLVALLALLLTSCGGDDDDSEAVDDEEVAADESAILRIPFNLNADQSGLNFDPAKAFSGADIQTLVYDSLLRTKPDGTTEPGLAKEVTVVDPQTIEIELQPDVEFSDGTPFNAEAVKAGILRQIQMRGPVNRVEIYELSEIVVADPTHLTIKLKTPVAGNWLVLLTGQETLTPAPSAVAAGADLTRAPVGAGPFVVESFESGAKVVLRKNPSYFQADQIRYGGIELVNIGSGPQSQQVSLNGLQSGQLDIAQLSPDVVGGLRGNSGFEIVDASSKNGWFQIYMCKNRPPFNDVKVRQALFQAIDRAATVKAVYGRDYPLADGMWQEGHPFYDEDLVDYYPYDPDEAKKLLSQAGYGPSNPLKFESFFTAGESQRYMEVIQQQLKSAGVEMSLVPVTDLFGQFLTRAEKPMLGGGMARQGTGKITRILGAGSPVNVCQYNNPELENTMKQLAAADQATPSDEAVELWHRAQELIWKDAAIITLGFTPISIVHNADWAGLEVIDGYTAGAPLPNYFKLYKKA
jgi:peptide/nickel transport system substrate-binding protein